MPRKGWVKGVNENNIEEEKRKTETGKKFIR
jgi:hypothetical protein